MPENTERILSHLQNFQGIESLRQLFWVELNYNRDNTSIENLPDGSSDLIIDSPISFATAGKNNDFHVIYTKLKSDKLLKTDERQIITHLQTRLPDALYVFSNSVQEQWHFINVKLTREQQEETEQQREEELKIRNIFRRITIGPNERLRTASERIAMLDVEEIGEPDGLFDTQDVLTSLDIRNGHEKAFNVEAVTEAFFEEFKRIFKRLQNELEEQTDNTKWAHDYALQFLSRCLFLYFVQRKRWLGEDTEFLHSFWQAYQDTSQPTDTFVDKWLNVLFFHSFNNVSVGGRRYFPDEIRKTLQFAPYLNGGLFRENALDKEYVVIVPDQLWRSIFAFFEKYNFTIAEDTPLDQEVAVDPEMIGKVYESLVSAEDEERGDAGIFYTPRVEIDLMCRLALVDNLANNIGTKEDKLRFYETLFAFEPEEKAEADEKLADLWQDVYDHITEITVVDPACGSGSFLVGMLHVLDDVRERAENHLGINAESRFERRKEIIGKNLYGVDVKEWACKVAELRLWLALIIDAEITDAELTVRKEPLLPDFSFNIRHGDSIVQDIGGMNVAQTRAIGSVIPSNFERKIKDLKNEKLKFYNSEEDRKYKEKEDVYAAENRLFREQLGNYETEIFKEIRKTKAWLEDPTEQMTLLDTEETNTKEVDRQTQQKKDELQRQEEKLIQVQGAIKTLSTIKSPPFVWDIAFVEIFNQRDGFDIVIENPPYISTKRIKDPMLPNENVTLANRNAYKEKLKRSIYQSFPDYFGYKENLNKVNLKIDGNSDLYIYFYLHGLSLLNSRGTFCAITAKAWLDVGYGRNLQEFLLKTVFLKLILNNSAKRSFASADINTVICLISAPINNTHQRSQHLTRFVNFKVPFEVILDAIIFYEIETAEVDTRRQEHRTYPISQYSLLEYGLDDNMKYTGDKWDAKYLRAPDIYWHLLKIGLHKLVQIRNIADTPRGYTTGANEFFLLDNRKLIDHNIEPEFLYPVISSPKEVASIRVNLETLPYQLFICSKHKQLLQGTNALKYIEWGESQEYHRRPGLENKSKWYDVGERPTPTLSFPRIINTTAVILYVPKGCHVTNSFVEIHVPHDIRVSLCYSLNSTLFQLMLNVMGRTGQGGGALVVANVEFEDLQCVNPQLIKEYSLNQNSLE